MTLIINLCCELCDINKDTPLDICAKEQMRAVIHFLWAEDVPGDEMQGRMSVQYGNSVMLQHTV